MICLKVDIPKELNDIDDELKAIYHSRDTVCFFIFKTRNERNEFVEIKKATFRSPFPSLCWSKKKPSPFGDCLGGFLIGGSSAIYFLLYYQLKD